jgi:hypothetical protein
MIAKKNKAVGQAAAGPAPIAEETEPVENWRTPMLTLDDSSTTLLDPDLVMLPTAVSELRSDVPNETEDTNCFWRPSTRGRVAFTLACLDKVAPDRIRATDPRITLLLRECCYVVDYVRILFRGTPTYSALKEFIAAQKEQNNLGGPVL